MQAKKKRGIRGQAMVREEGGVPENKIVSDGFIKGLKIVSLFVEVGKVLRFKNAWVGGVTSLPRLRTPLAQN